MKSLSMLRALTRVQTVYRGQPLSSASGFYFRRGGNLYLVTSRHVMFDGPTAHAPDLINVFYHTDADDLTQFRTLALPLYAQGQALWRVASDAAGEIDVAVLPIDQGILPVKNLLQSFCVADLAVPGESWEVGTGLLIPGFPLGFHDHVHHLPVVRSAALASAYGIRFQGCGYFLTDSRTHRGSSGAPILFLQESAKDSTRWRLLGVHSSRMDMVNRNVALDESLGLNCAWYANVLLTLTSASEPTYVI